MGNNSSKKNQQHTMSNYHEIFSSHKSLFENKIDYDEREHLGTSLLREIYGGNYSSPIQDILNDSNAKILDIGCGSGFWLIEMAAVFKNPKFIGIEMLSIFPKSTFPSNVEFVKQNFLDGLNCDDNTFDFIHMQSLGCDFTKSQWETFIFQELARVLKPGGWLEICDCEFKLKDCGPKSARLSKAVNEYLMSKDVDPNIILCQESLIKSIPSFSSSNMRHEVRQLPLSSQTSNIGKFGGIHIKEHLRSFLRGPVGHNMNIERKNIDSTMNEIGHEFDLNGTYLTYHRFCVQKQC